MVEMQTPHCLDKNLPKVRDTSLFCRLSDKTVLGDFLPEGAELEKSGAKIQAVAQQQQRHQKTGRAKQYDLLEDSIVQFRPGKRPKKNSCQSSHSRPPKAALSGGLLQGPAGSLRDERNSFNVVVRRDRSFHLSRSGEKRAWKFCIDPANVNFWKSVRAGIFTIRNIRHLPVVCIEG
jgi:hypothetical protein